MSASDAYVFACYFSAIGLVAVGSARVVEAWPRWRDAHRVFAKVAEWRWVCWHASLYDAAGTVWFPTDPSPRRRRG